MKLTLPLALAFLALFAIPGITAAAPPKPRRHHAGGGKQRVPQRPTGPHARPGPINDGDYVSTGAATSVRIGLTADGYAGVIQLDENTDPNLIIATGCIIMRMLKGQALVNAKNICLGTTNISGVTRSVVNFKADATRRHHRHRDRRQLELQKPTPMMVGDRNGSSPCPTEPPTNMRSTRQRPLAVRVTQRYDFNKPETAPHDSHGSHVAAGVLGAILGGVVLCKAGVICDDDHDDDHDNPTTVRAPANRNPSPAAAITTARPSLRRPLPEECAAKGGTASPREKRPRRMHRCCAHGFDHRLPPFAVASTTTVRHIPSKPPRRNARHGGLGDQPGAEGQCSSIR
jgi:hypothetical protein